MLVSAKCWITIDDSTLISRSSACKMVRTLVQLMRTLDKMPEEVNQDLKSYLGSSYLAQKSLENIMLFSFCLFNVPALT